MTFKHTPGPWRISDYLDNRDMIIVGPDDFDVAIVGYPNRNQNARLIAAAPELLVALQIVLGKDACGALVLPPADRERIEALVKAVAGGDA